MLVHQFADLEARLSPISESPRVIHAAVMDLANRCCDPGCDVRVGSRFNHCLVDLPSGTGPHFPETELQAYMSAPRSFSATPLERNNSHREVPVSVLLGGVGQICPRRVKRSASVTARYELSMTLPRALSLAGFVSHKLSK